MPFRTAPALPERLNRCPLFGPASRPELFTKMAGRAADVVNLDLEDAVAPGDKAAARANAGAATLDGRMIGHASIRQARVILRRHEHVSGSAQTS